MKGKEPYPIFKLLFNKARSCYRFLYTLALIVLFLLFEMVGTVMGATQSNRGFQHHTTTNEFKTVDIMVEPGKTIPLYQKSFALLIGVSEYEQHWPILPGVNRDIESVKQLLVDQGFDVTVVKNPDHIELRTAYINFINAHGMEPDNRLLFYFAGHGHTMKLAYGQELGYIIPANAPAPDEDKSKFLQTALDINQIEVFAKQIQSKHALFMFDSCFSGTVFSKSREVPQAISYKTALPVRQFITSGSADETVPDESIFSKQFIIALKGDGDLNHDGYITGTELGIFLETKIINYSKNSQHPQYGKIRNPFLDKGDFVFQVKTIDGKLTFILEPSTIKKNVTQETVLSPRDIQTPQKNSNRWIWHTLAITSTLALYWKMDDLLKNSKDLDDKNNKLETIYQQQWALRHFPNLIKEHENNRQEIQDLDEEASIYFNLALLSLAWETYLIFTSGDDDINMAQDNKSGLMPEVSFVPHSSFSQIQLSLRWLF